MEGRGAKNATMAFFKLPPCSCPSFVLERPIYILHNVQKDNQPQYINIQTLFRSEYNIRTHNYMAYKFISSFTNSQDRYVCHT
jgi:hypothetical protein